MKSKGKNNNFTFIILTVVITLVIALALIYFLFIKKPDEGGNSNSTISNQQTTDNTNVQLDNNEKIKLTKQKLTSANVNIKLKDGTINLKAYDKSLYLNDKKIYTSDLDNGSFTGYSIYTNEKTNYIFLEVDNRSICGDDSGYFVGAINLQGKIMEIESKFDNDYVDLPVCSLDIYLDQGKFYGTYSGVDTDNKNFSYNVEFVIK